MPGKSSGRLHYSVACVCGATSSLDIRAFGKPTFCRSCGATYTVAWKRERGSSKQVPVAVTQARTRGGAQNEGRLILFCTCGYRLPIPPAQADTRHRCPGCGKAMILEQSGLSKIPEPDPTRLLPPVQVPKPLPPLARRAPLVIRISAEATSYDCPCGERLLLRSNSVGKTIQCPACERHLALEDERDAPAAPPPPLRRVGAPPQPRSSWDATPVPPLSSRDPTPTPAAPTPPAIPLFAPKKRSAPPAKAPTPTPAALSQGLTCLCGRPIDVHVVLTQKEVRCVGCGRTVRMDRQHSTHSSLTMVRPVFTDPAPAGPAKASAPPPRIPKPVPGPQPETPSESAIFSQDQAPGASPFYPPSPAVPRPFEVPALRPAQEVFCQCGEALLVGFEDVGQNLQCPTCGLLMEVESDAGALRVRPIGKVVDDTWSMDDFK